MMYIYIYNDSNTRTGNSSINSMGVSKNVLVCGFVDADILWNKSWTRMDNGPRLDAAFQTNPEGLTSTVWSLQKVNGLMILYHSPPI